MRFQYVYVFKSQTEWSDIEIEFDWFFNIIMLYHSNNSIWEMSIFYKWKYFFRHLKLEIALAIPAANDEKYKLTILQLKGIYKI